MGGRRSNGIRGSLNFAARGRRRTTPSRSTPILRICQRAGRTSCISKCGNGRCRTSRTRVWSNPLSVWIPQRGSSTRGKCGCFPTLAQLSPAPHRSRMCRVSPRPNPRQPDVSRPAPPTCPANRIPAWCRQAVTTRARTNSSASRSTVVATSPAPTRRPSSGHATMRRSRPALLPFRPSIASWSKALDATRFSASRTATGSRSPTMCWSSQDSQARCAASDRETASTTRRTRFFSRPRYRPAAFLLMARAARHRRATRASAGGITPAGCSMQTATCSST